MALVGKKLQREEVSEEFQEILQDDVIDPRQLPECEKQEREASLQYHHLQLQQRILVDGLLRGRLPMDQVPCRKHRTVKVFIASTSTDMREEQDALMAEAYPKLRQYCRQRYAVDFQAVDMTWGMPANDHPDPSTVHQYMETLRQCQRESVGPSFVALLGQKYGDAVLPYQINRETYDPLRTIMKEQDNSSKLLDKWYIKDINAVPNFFTLRSPTEILGSNLSEWPQMRQDLLEKMRSAAAVGAYKGTIEPGFLHSLEASVLEREVVLGLSNPSTEGQLDDQCMSLLRTMSDLHHYLDRTKVTSFCDIIPNTNDINKEKYGQLESLIREILHKYLKRSSLLKETIKWSDPNGVDPKKTKHKAYLSELCIRFFNVMRDKIDATMQDHQRDFITNDALLLEVVQAWDGAREASSKFHGREEIMEQIMWYIIDETDRPLVLHGEPGVGKTSIVCKAAGQVHEWLAQNGRSFNTTVILRMCDTPTSSNVRTLLHGLCHQMAYATEQQRHQVPTDLKGMRTYFKNLIENAEFRGLMVIFLDAVDELSSVDDAHRLDWLPKKLSNNVKVILTTSPGRNGILHRLRESNSDESYYINVPPLKSNKCCEILNAWLGQHNRMISFHQWRVVKDAFLLCSLPLYMEQVFQESRMWCSYTPNEDITLKETIQASVRHMLDKLEVSHGEVLVSHTLGLLCASRRGLSEAELENVLSLDEDILDVVFKSDMPHVRRIPPFVLQRLLHDVSRHVVHREVDKITGLFWSHALVADIVRDHYTQHDTYLQNLLADFYLGTWSNRRQKPFRYSAALVKKRELATADAKAIRHVPEQPTVLDTCSTTGVYNVRKLNQLPFHLMKASRVPVLKEEVLFSYEWLRAKICACSIQEVITDYDLVEGKEMSLVAEALKLSETAVTEDPKLLGVELAGRLLPYYKRFNNIRSLIDQCDTAAMRYSPLMPVWQTYATPGGPQQYGVNIGQGISPEDISMFHTADTTYVVVKPFNDSRMSLWDVTAVEKKPMVVVPAESEVYPSPDGRTLHTFSNSSELHSYNVSNMDRDSGIKFPCGKIGNVAVSQKYLAVTLNGSASPILMDTEARMVVNRFQYQSQAVALSTEGHFIACNAGLSIVLHQIPLLERKCTISTTNLAEKIIFTRDQCHFFTMFQNHEIHSATVNLVQKKAKTSLVVRDLEMQDFKLSNSKDLMLVHSSRSLRVIAVRSEEVLQHIQKMPPGIYVDGLSTFVDACFTADNSKLVAARQSYLCVWDAHTGKPLRVLQPSVCLITNLFIPGIDNIAITALADSSMQVWNLTNLDEDVQYSATAVKGPVARMAVSEKGNRVIVAGSSRAEARVLNLLTGHCEHVLQHSDDFSLALDDVILSPTGNFAVTRLANELTKDQESWPELKEDKLWNLATGNAIHCGADSRFVAFSEDDSKIVFFPCRGYSSKDWADTCYDAVVVDIQNRDNYLVELPDGEILGHPVLINNGEYLVYILQNPNMGDGADFGGVVATQCKVQVYLCAYSFDKHWRGFKYVDIHNIWSGINEDDIFIDVQPFSADHILLTYGKDIGQLHHRPDGTVDRSRVMSKGALVYNVSKDCLLKRFDSIFQPDTDMDTLLTSSKRSHFLDRKLHVFNGLTGFLSKKLDLEKLIIPETARLLLDGRYMAVVSANRREIHVYRTQDGRRRSRVFVHGTAECLETGPQDRTVVVGCSDGRVMTFVLLLESPDHVTEIVRPLPSRAVSSVEAASSRGLGKDVRHIQQTENEHRQLSAIARRDIAAFKAIQTA